jgi:hypothetical protein
MARWTRRREVDSARMSIFFSRHAELGAIQKCDLADRTSDQDGIFRAV